MVAQLEYVRDIRSLVDRDFVRYAQRAVGEPGR